MDVVYRRCDGSLSADWDPTVVALVASCRCVPADGAPTTWTGRDHPVTESGATAALADWDRVHVARLLAGTADAGRSSSWVGPPVPG